MHHHVFAHCTKNEFDLLPSITSLGSKKPTATVPTSAPPHSWDETVKFCSQRIQVQNFEFGAFRGVNDFYSLVKEDDVDGGKDTGSWSTHLTNGRGVYKGEENPRNCIWWHKQFRHWWLGDCLKRGNNHGFAWLQPDVTCPQDGAEGDWHRGGSDEVLSKGKIKAVVSVIKGKNKKLKDNSSEGRDLLYSTILPTKIYFAFNAQSVQPLNSSTMLQKKILTGLPQNW